MSSCIAFDRFPAMAGMMEMPAQRGRFIVNHLVSVSKQSLPDDAIGTFALTLTNVVVGSAIQIEDQAGTVTLYNGTAATSSPLINLSAYAGGSPLNSLRIKVRKASAAPYYKPYETLAVALVGSQSIYIAQIPD